MDKTREKRFMIIDGNAILHRAYHALPPLTTSDGRPIGAVFGFFSMLLKLLSELKPEYLAVSFDRPKPTFRKTLYVGYQAHRPQMDEELGSQIKILHEILDEINIPIYEVDGFEADDLIGTLALQAQPLKYQRSNIKDQKENMEVVIVSGDRDMLQLVNHNVKVLAPVLGISQMILFDREKVKEKYGLEPSQMISYKALVGDPSDNYPGVAGIGPKTASFLINKYHNLEGVYSHISDIEKENQKLALKLASNQQNAILANELATIIKDVPILFSAEDCDLLKLKKEKMIENFKKLGFNSLIKRLDDVYGNKKPEDKKKKNNQMKLLD